MRSYRPTRGNTDSSQVAHKSIRLCRRQSRASPYPVERRWHTRDSWKEGSSTWPCTSRHRSVRQSSGYERGCPAPPFASLRCTTHTHRSACAHLRAHTCVHTVLCDVAVQVMVCVVAELEDDFESRTRLLKESFAHQEAIANGRMQQSAQLDEAHAQAHAQIAPASLAAKSLGTSRCFPRGDFLCYVLWYAMRRSLIFSGRTRSSLQSFMRRRPRCRSCLNSRG